MLDGWCRLKRLWRLWKRRKRKQQKQLTSPRPPPSLTPPPPRPALATRPAAPAAAFPPDHMSCTTHGPAPRYRRRTRVPSVAVCCARSSGERCAEREGERRVGGCGSGQGCECGCRRGHWCRGDTSLYAEDGGGWREWCGSLGRGVMVVN